MLVVAATSPKQQWKQEIEKFASRSVESVEGLLARRCAKDRTDSFYKIANYDVIPRDVEAIRQWAPDLIVLDEARRLFVLMTPQQWHLHEENRAIVARIVNKWRNCRFLSDADQKRLTCALQSMRMSCNSSYRLDSESDHGVKADEIVTLLSEWLERRETKAVVFSQWVRSHELLAWRLSINQRGARSPFTQWMVTPINPTMLAKMAP